MRVVPDLGTKAALVPKSGTLGSSSHKAALQHPTLCIQLGYRAAWGAAPGLYGLGAVLVCIARLYDFLGELVIIRSALANAAAFVAATR